MAATPHCRLLKSVSLFVSVLQGPLSAGVQGGSLMVLCFWTYCMLCLYSPVGLFDVPPENWAATEMTQSLALSLLSSKCVWFLLSGHHRTPAGQSQRTGLKHAGSGGGQTAGQHFSLIVFQNSVVL